MIGYLRPLGHDPEHRAVYASYQCGLCHHIGATYGFPYRLFAGPDLVFYNVWLDRVAGAEAPLERRACVLAPGVTRLPSRKPTDHTAIAAAFGVWMAVEKLRDDWDDDGGTLRWLAWRAFAPGAAKARAHLASVGFPVAAIEAELAEQRRLEALPRADLAEAARPTATIARLAFGFAAGDAPIRPAVERIGEQLGRFLFAMDNALDLPKDRRDKSYNALDRAFPDAEPEAAQEVALDGARRAVAAIEADLGALSDRDTPYLRHVLVRGFRDKIVRFERMSADRRATATLRAILPPPKPMTTVLREGWDRFRARAFAQLQLRLALLLLFLFPKAAFASRWWPEDADETLGLTDTGLPADHPDSGDTGAPSDPYGDQASDHFLDAWVCTPCTSNCGWIECAPCQGCEDACSDACSCNEACDIDCGC